MADFLGEEFSLVQIDKLYGYLDRLLLHKESMFSFLQRRWKILLDVSFGVLLYDLTRPILNAIPQLQAKGSLDTAWTNDRIWIMDRGIPTEDILTKMRKSEHPVHYLVGTLRGSLSKLEKKFLDLPWSKARELVDVKLLENEGELYMPIRSTGRVNKERFMRMRRLKKLWKRLHELQGQKLTRDQLLIKLGAAKKEAGRAWLLVKNNLPEKTRQYRKKRLPLCWTRSDWAQCVDGETFTSMEI